MGPCAGNSFLALLPNAIPANKPYFWTYFWRNFTFWWNMVSPEFLEPALTQTFRSKGFGGGGWVVSFIGPIVQLGEMLHKLLDTVACRPEEGHFVLKSFSNISPSHDFVPIKDHRKNLVSHIHCAITATATHSMLGISTPWTSQVRRQQTCHAAPCRLLPGPEAT